MALVTLSILPRFDGMVGLVALGVFFGVFFWLGYFFVIFHRRIHAIVKGLRSVFVRHLYLKL